MEISKRLLGTRRARWLAALTVVAVALLLATLPLPTRAGNGRVVAIYYDGIEHTVVTDAPTIAEVLKRTNISVTEFDSVEPGLDTKLTAPSYNVNIYRARPVTVVDGNQRHQVMSPHTSARKIAEDAGLVVREEDEFDLQRIDNFIAEEGVGLRMTIQRAIPVNLVLYGKPSHVYTQAATVQELLTEKQVTIGEADGTNLALAAGLTPGITVEVWRDGEQTITEELAVTFPVERIRDTDQPVGYRQIKTPGKNGKKLVTYAIELKNGQEVGRKEIQSVIIEQAKEQIEIVGVKPGSGLSKSKGVNFYVDSKGVSHRETYYDLLMNVVMKACGGGTYSVRADGAKVDQEGYILVAANLNRYPRCSIVETSLGAGKVYDTGGFATVHPDGFDLATDWSNNDGR